MIHVPDFFCTIITDKATLYIPVNKKSMPDSMLKIQHAEFYSEIIILK